MTGNDEGKWVLGQGSADSASCQGVAEKRSDKAIGTDLPTRYTILGKEYSALKVRTNIQTDNFQRKMDVLTMQEGLD